MSELGFHFSDDGDSKLPAVVFLHAFPLHGGMWDRQRQAVAHVARPIAIDFRGFGKSPAPSVPFLLEHLVDDVLALLDHLGIERAYLCGLSLGGYVALRTIERAPERVAGLLLADTQAAADANAAKLKRADGIRQILTSGVGPYVDAFSKNALAPATLTDHPEIVTQARQLMLEAPASALIHGLVALATRTDTTDALSSISVPTRVLVGDKDAITPPEVARKLAAAIPNADVHEILRAGHLANLESPEAFDALLVEHVTRVFSG